MNIIASFKNIGSIICGTTLNMRSHNINSRGGNYTAKCVKLHADEAVRLTDTYVQGELDLQCKTFQSQGSQFKVSGTSCIKAQTIDFDRFSRITGEGNLIFKTDNAQLAGRVDIVGKVIFEISNSNAIPNLNIKADTVIFRSPNGKIAFRGNVSASEIRYESLEMTN